MGFAELFVIAIVGLIVIGPDKLPQTIKTCLTWFGRIKRLVSETRSEFEQQLGMDEIRREVHNEEVLASLKALKDAKNSTVNEVKGYAEKARQESKIFDDFDSDDDDLFGEQYANHPPEPPAEPVKPLTQDHSDAKKIAKEPANTPTSKGRKPKARKQKENLQK